MIYNTRQGLSGQVKEMIVEMIKTRDFKNNRLPAESRMAEELGVSVAVVREALLLLKEDGVITKKHGSGNYIHRSALDLESRIDQYEDFIPYLENKGYKAEDRIISLEITNPNPALQEYLKLTPDEEIVHYRRLISADGNAAVYCEIFLPLKLFLERPTIENIGVGLNTIFVTKMNVELAYGKLRFFPYLTTEEDTKNIGFPAGRALIMMKEQYFSLEDIPMAYSKNLFNDEYVTVNLLSR